MTSLVSFAERRVIIMRKEILLVEDDCSLNRAVSLKLEREGYQVYAAENAQEAYAFYREHNVTLIICDIDLPDGSGLDFCMEVRKNERTGNAAGCRAFRQAADEDAGRRRAGVRCRDDGGGHDDRQHLRLPCIPVGKGQPLHERYGLSLSRMGNSAAGCNADSRAADDDRVHTQTARKGKPDRQNKGRGIG